MIEPSQQLQKIFEKFIIDLKADPDFVKLNIEGYLKNNLNDIVAPNYSGKPKKTNSVERVLNRCFTQVLFSGRQEIEVYDVIVSILAETNSFSYYFLTKAGLNKEKFAKYYKNRVLR